MKCGISMTQERIYDNKAVVVDDGIEFVHEIMMMLIDKMKY